MREIKFSDGYKLKEMYDFSCCICEEDQCMSPSQQMRDGLNEGSGKCILCGEKLSLKVCEETDSVIVMSWKEYEKKSGIITENERNKKWLDQFV